MQVWGFIGAAYKGKGSYSARWCIINGSQKTDISLVRVTAWVPLVWVGLCGKVLARAELSLPAIPLEPTARLYSVQWVVFCPKHLFASDLLSVELVQMVYVNSANSANSVFQ